MDGVIQWQSATPIPPPAKRSKDPDWERKQRLREYRVAARREKRNRKADEKKQRKLNATILRRMTRNPDKYTKNADRNRMRAIEVERRTIQFEAIKQVQRLAAVHDPTGVKFNISPVVIQEDGSVISHETIRRREEREKARKEESGALHETTTGSRGNAERLNSLDMNGQDVLLPGINRDRLAQMDLDHSTRAVPIVKKMSKTQQKKLAQYEHRPPPSKPIIPEGISIPEGEEKWLELWDLPDEQLERRVIRAKKRKAAARKQLRVKQQSGKVERRAARDEKRKVYRELKNTWKTIKDEEKRHKTKLRSAEDEEAKKIAVAIAIAERQTALEMCGALGITMENTEGLGEIKPKALGMKGIEVDFDTLDVGDSSKNDVKPRAAFTANNTKVLNKRRVDLSTAARYDGSYVVPVGERKGEDPGDYIQLDVGDGLDHEALNYNHKLRRKLRRAIELADIKKEMLVRNKAIEWCKKMGFEPPPELSAPAKPDHLRGYRALEDGTLETAKAERVRLRLELAEFNKAARVLRRQAKEIAMERGLRVYAEMTGRIAPREEELAGHGPGWILPEEKPVDDILRLEDMNTL